MSFDGSASIKTDFIFASLNEMVGAISPAEFKAQAQTHKEVRDGYLADREKKAAAFAASFANVAGDKPRMAEAVEQLAAAVRVPKPDGLTS
jgi:hypothetical protein